MGPISLSILFVSLVFCRLPAHGEQSVRLLEYANAWRFNNDGLALPADWKNPGYDDSSWPSGPGVLGWPPDEPLIGLATINSYLSLNSPVTGAPVITHYFRTQFHFPSNPGPNLVLVATNLLDDGAVLYLNGHETVRIGMSPGAPAYATYANRGREVANGPERVVLPTTNLVQGLNTVAVELHQNSTNLNSDAIFGLSLTAVFLDPIQIIDEPDDLTLVQGEEGELSVSVTGSNPRFQWYRGGSVLTNQTNAVFRIVNPPESLTGDYRVVVSGPLNTVTSRVAKVTVLRDIFPPVLLSAEEFLSTASTQHLLLTFNEDIFRGAFGHPNSGTNVNHYLVEEVGTTNVLQVTNIVIAVGAHAVRLQVVPRWRAGATYRVTVSNLADFRTNVMLQPQSAYVGFYFRTNLASFDAIWAWNDSEDVSGFAWREINYADDLWGFGPGPFAYDPAATTFCTYPKGSTLSLGSTTYYFRYPFVVERTSGKVVFTIREAIDDGAVYYLNGQEIRRVNMPSGPIFHQTFASTIREPDCSQDMIFSATNLVEGTNILAVEVHQATPDVDVVFALQATAAIQMPYPKPVPLNIARTASGDLIVYWPQGEGRLEAAPRLQGPWTAIATNPPIVFPPLTDQGFFRLQPILP